MKIFAISSREILNSGGLWTVEVEVALEGGAIGTASVPGGISRGKNEAFVFAAEDSIAIIEKIKEKLVNRDFPSQKDFDNFLLDLDNTPDKSNLGSNTTLGLSTAFCKASASLQKAQTWQYIQTITEAQKGNPKPMMLMLEGGKHGSGEATIQEFMVLVDSIETGVEIYHKVKDDLHSQGKSTNVGAEGAFSPEGFDNMQVLQLLSKHLNGNKIALDVAASSFDPDTSTPNYDLMLTNFPILSIEDPFGEEDWDKWQEFAKNHLSGTNSINPGLQPPPNLMIVTDDLTATNLKLLKQAIELEVGNAIIIKPNQIGTVTETLQVMKMAKDAGWKRVVSHRGTDTNDDFLADLAVGAGAEFVKFGAPSRGERVTKYNRLLSMQG